MENQAKPGSVASIVALANRFVALKAGPGFHDLVLLGEMLEQEARDAVTNYEGKDPNELFMLNIRSQVARQFIREFFGRIDGAIANAKGLPGFQAESGVQPVINERIAGSY